MGIALAILPAGALFWDIRRSLRSLLARLSRRQLLTRCSGAGFSSLRRVLGWLPPHLAGPPHPQEERLSRAIAAGLLHLDDPDRLRATAASLAASAPPDDQALAVLWQAGAWREELIQLLLLLAERPLKQPQRRLHPLPWALPVPLRVHGHYTRAEIEAAYCFSARRLRLLRSLRLGRALHRRPLDPPRNGSTIAS